jgi:polar amino acid transport system substrate-binding protein
MRRHTATSWRRPTAGLAALATITILVAGCGTSTPAPAVAVSAPHVLPAGVSFSPPSTSAAATNNSCNAVASLRPSAPLPAPGKMPAGSFMAKIEQAGHLTAGVDQSTFLWGYRDPQSGQLTGFDIDMLHQVSQAIFGNPNRIRFIVVPNSQRIPAIQSGAVDIVAETMTINCARKQMVDFSTVYYNAGQRILAPVDSQITGPPSLAGKRVCATSGSTSIQNLQTLKVTPPVKAVAAVNQADCLVLLQQGQVDAISTDDTILQGLAAQDPNVQLVGQAFTAEPYGMAISKAHPEFVAFVNAVLARERADGTWAAIYKRWLARFDGGRVPAPPAATYSGG